jgi:hypothetical protein
VEQTRRQITERNCRDVIFSYTNSGSAPCIIVTQPSKIIIEKRENSGGVFIGGEAAVEEAVGGAQVAE